MVIAGIIRPPPDIRAVVDRTAEYVAKNGRAFEARILKSEKGRSPKFAFLQPSSPFHAYYEDRIRVYEKGAGEESEEIKEEKGLKDEKLAPKSNGQSQVRKEKKQQATAADPIAKAVLLHRGRIAKVREKESSSGEPKQHESIHSSTLHPLDLVSILPPSDLLPVQIETMQLVAQYASLDGKGGTFLHRLSVREWSNKDFAFCQPRHPHFSFFSAMVDAYGKIIGNWSLGKQMMVGEKRTLVSQALDQAAYRAEYDRAMAKLDSNPDGKGPGVDWHDFVVVETIDFPVDEVVELSMLPPPPPTIRENDPLTRPTTGSGVDEGETIRVVPSYTPRVVVPAKLKETKAIDPISGKSISIADMPEHMRIQLLDPKWAKDKKKFQEKQKESNLVGADAVAANITRFVGASRETSSFNGGVQRLPVMSPGFQVTEKNKHSRRAVPLQTLAPQNEEASSGTEPAKKRIRIADEANLAASHNPGVATDYSSSPNPDIHIEPHVNSVPTEKAASNKDTELLSAEDFLASLGKPEATLQVRIPNDPSQIAWNFYGQILSMKVHVMTKIRDIKTELSRRHLNGMPPNKIQLRDTASGFLKDGSTLASLNIGPTATVEIIPKTRGGRK